MFLVRTRDQFAAQGRGAVFGGLSGGGQLALEAVVWGPEADAGAGGDGGFGPGVEGVVVGVVPDEEEGWGGAVEGGVDGVGGG